MTESDTGTMVLLAKGPARSSEARLSVEGGATPSKSRTEFAYCSRVKRLIGTPAIVAAEQSRLCVVFATGVVAVWVPGSLPADPPSPMAPTHAVSVRAIGRVTGDRTVPQTVPAPSSEERPNP